MRPILCTMLIALGISFSFFSCEQEEIVSETSSADSTLVAIDSSQLRHNLKWNGHYYLLKFDTAFAWFSSDYFIKSTSGGHPVPLVFESDFIDEYSGEKFALFMVHYTQNTSVWSNYFFYSSYEAKQRLTQYGAGLIDDMDWNFFGTGVVMKKGGKYGERVFPNYDTNHAYDDIMEVISYQTHVGTEVTSNYHIKVTRNQFLLDIEGMFRAQ